MAFKIERPVRVLKTKLEGLEAFNYTKKLQPIIWSAAILGAIWGCPRPSWPALRKLVAILGHLTHVALGLLEDLEVVTFWAHAFDHPPVVIFGLSGIVQETSCAVFSRLGKS